MLQPTFRLEPGDGTGASIADAEVRNARGECAMMDCGQPWVSEKYFFGRLCEEHHQEYQDEARHLMATLDEDFIRNMTAADLSNLYATCTRPTDEKRTSETTS